MGWQPFLLEFDELGTLVLFKGADVMFKTLPFDGVVWGVWCVVGEVGEVFSMPKFI